jgi:hypothetical protein
LSLVEVLVVILAIGVLALLLACASRRAREAAAGNECQDNLRQLMLAVHHYAGTNDGALPSCCSAPHGRPWDDGQGDTYPQSFFFTLLPFLGREDLYEAGMQATTNGATWMGSSCPDESAPPLYAAAFVKTYICPDDPTNSPEHLTGAGWVGSSYACNFQVFGNPLLLATEPKDPSLKCYQPILKLGNIPGGTSKTIFLAERFAQYPGGPGQFIDPEGKVDQANNLWAWPAAFATHPPTSYQKPAPQNAALFAYALQYNEVSDDVTGYGQAALSPPQIGVAPEMADYRLTQSAHDKVLYVGMGDGSCRGISPGVTADAWKWALDPISCHEGPDW